MKNVVPAIFVLLAAAWLTVDALPRRTQEKELPLAEVGAIPVAHLGRVKPLDTVARTSLLVLSRRQTFIDANGDRRPAIQWLLDAIVDPEKAIRHRVFRIDNLDVLSSLKLSPREGFRYALSEFMDAIPELFKQADAAEARKQAKEPIDAYEAEALKLANNLNMYMHLVQGDTIHALPPNAGVDWRPIGQIMEGTGEDETALLKIFEAYRANDADALRQTVAAYRARLQPRMPEKIAKADFEVFFNRVEPFYHCTILYVLAFLLACFSWLVWPVPLGRAAFALTAFTWVVHTAALIARIYISEKGPVTNLYASAIFIGWAAILLCLILEAVFRLGVGTVVASILGFATLLIAHFLSADGDTMIVLQAVLDTPYWLWTHVTCVTIGYAATFVAGLIAILHILRGVLTPSLTPDVGKAHNRMTYGVVCFALLFSFVGTVLGGLWADDSWGRFWGWDPKENGALIIVLWNALILHARWGGMVRERGFAVLAVFGNVVTCWSWFGVNQLSVGLHNYGFTDGVSMALWVTVGVHAAIMVLGMTPARLWWSTRVNSQSSPSEARP